MKENVITTMFWKKTDKSGTFSDQISVHFGAPRQNVLKSDLKKSRICPCTEIWSEKVLDLSILGRIWPILCPNLITQPPHVVPVVSPCNIAECVVIIPVQRLCFVGSLPFQSRSLDYECPPRMSYSGPKWVILVPKSDKSLGTFSDQILKLSIFCS